MTLTRFRRGRGRVRLRLGAMRAPAAAVLFALALLLGSMPSHAAGPDQPAAESAAKPSSNAEPSSAEPSSAKPSSAKPSSESEDSGAAGAAASKAAEGAPEAPPGPEDPYDRGTPRSAIHGYLVAGREGDWSKAAHYLDLSDVSEARRATRGPILARELKTVLDRSLWIDLDQVSNDPEGQHDDGQPWYRDRIGRISKVDPPVPIYLDRVPRASDGVRIWKVSSATVERIPALWKALGDGPLVEWLPEPFFTIEFLEIKLWQWIGLALLIGAALGAGALVVRAASLVFRPFFGRFPTLRLTFGPLRLLVAIGLFASVRYLLNLSVPAQNATGGLVRIATILALTWLCFRLVDAGERSLADRLRAQPGTGALLVMGRRTAKALLAALAVLASLQSVGINVTALLAGLGFGGLAFALAAQKSLENLFGGVTIMADQPVRVGDFCRFGDRVGIVEDVGLRSTRIRTLDRTVVTVPNAQFSTMELENFTRRDRIWYHPTIGLRYETTPDQIRYVLVEIRKLLYAHPKVDSEAARIRFTTFGAYSLDLEIFSYIETTDFGEYLEVAEDLNLRIMDVVERAGTGFAFPSRTLYLGKDTGLDGEAAKRAQEQVAEWRSRQELLLPGFPPERIRELDDTLDYPPEGSALRDGKG